MDHNQKTLPPINRDPSKERENKLAERLYKNNSMKKLSNTAEFSYLKNINPDSSILAGGSMNKSNSSKNFLIPSVSLKRNKEIDMSQRSLQISHGKVLLSSPKNQEPTFLHYKGDLKTQLQKSSTKTLFRKITRYDGINEKKIIPDELLGCSSDQENSKIQNFEGNFNRSNGSPKNSLSKGAKILKGFKNQSSKINQDDDALTPMDFIQLAQQDGSITNEFCYLKKMSHAYDLRIVEFQAATPTNLSNPSKNMSPSMLSPTDEYITISSRGVSYFSQQNSRFVPLERWKKEAYYFSKLMKLEFFSKYRLFKNFAKWKKHIRKTAMKSTTDKLRNELMIGDKFLRRALLGVKDFCFVMESDTNYCKFDDCENVMQFSSFKNCQEQFIQNEFENRILQIQEDIKNNLITNMSDSMREFKEENKISTSNESKGIPLLIGDEKNLDMPYTKEATLRIQQQKFKKFLKLIEFMIVDSKIKMMNESTQKIVKKIQEENETYEKQVIESKYKYPFKGKQYIKCAVKINVEDQMIQLKPTRDDLNYMFEEIVNRAIVKLCRNHKRIINDDEILQIIYDSNDKAVKQPETNILKVIIMSDDRQEKIVNSLNQSINTTYSYLESYSNRFTNMVEMYFDNLDKLNAISTYEAKDHEIIKQSLERWKNQLTEINALSQEHQSAIFLLDFQEFKNNAIRIVTECFQKMKKVMPEIYLSTTKSLLIQLETCLDKMKVKPLQIEDFIQFQKNKNDITNKMDSYSDRLSEISCMWINIKENCSTSEIANITKQQQQQQLGKPQLKLNRLRTSLEEAQMNTKAYETNAQQLLKSRIPFIKDEIYKLYNNKMKNNKFDGKSNIQEVSRAIEEYQITHDNIIQIIKQIKEFQQQLSMEEYNEETMTKFSAFFSNYKKIWRLHQNIQLCKEEILNQPWTGINIEQAKKQVDNFFNEAMKLKKDIATQSADDEEFKIPSSDIGVLSDVFLEAKNMKPLIQTVECLRDKSLSEKEWKEIKSYFQKINKEHVCSIIDIENKEATVSQIQDHKISQELDFIQSIVFRSKKQLEILSKINFVNKFWTEKNTDNIAKNLTENFQNSYWDIIMEVDEKITVINGISEDSEMQAQEIKQGIIQNKNLLNSLRTLLTEWETHERYFHYFEPIFANPYWKSNPKEHKIYLQIDNNWNKLIKQCKDVSPKKLASNEKIIAIIRENIGLFEQLKKTIEDFLNNKRDIFPKFYFLSNEELIHVLQSEKEVRSIEEHINKVFTCIKSLEAKELGPIIVATESQSLPVKFTKAFNNIEVEEIFKTLEEGIKSAVKSNLKNCLQIFQKDGDFNKRNWIKDHLLQSLLFIQNLEYTKIIEFDYMGNEADDLSQYLIYQNTQIKELQYFLNENSDEPEMYPGKIETLIVQEILHRQITEMLLKNHIIETESYEWKKQIRCYNMNSSINNNMANTIVNNENYFTQFFVNQVEYGLQFIDLQGAYPYVMFSERQAIELSMALKLKYTPVIKGHEHLILNFSKFNAKYYRNILCDSRISEKYIANVCFGVYLEGCFVQFQEAEKLRYQQISIIANFMKEIYSSLNRNDKIFNFGWKKSPLNLTTIGSGIFLKLSDISSMNEFTQNLQFNHKSHQFKTMPYGLYVNLMIQIRKKNCKKIGSKLMKFIDIIHDVEGYQIFSFEHIRHLLKEESFKEVQNFESNFVKEILDIISQKLVSTKKITFYKQILFDIFFEDKNKQEKMNESTLLTSKIIKDKSDLKYFVNSLVEITEKKSICVVAGPTQSGKISLISEAYKQRICRVFEVEIMNIDILNSESLFGCYVNGLWMEGILIKKIKQLPLSKQEWIVFEGSSCQKTVDIIDRLNHRYLQLSNGEIVFLSQEWKFIFAIYNFEENFNNLPKNIDILQSTSFISIKDSTEIMVEKRIKPHFQKDPQSKSLQNYSLIENKCGSRELKGMKVMGVKNDYLKAQNILRYLINILDALLTGISSDIKAHKDFSKGIQKIFTWSIYWCIGSCLPSEFAKKYESSLFENSKGDIEYSQNLGEIRIQFDTPAGSLKKIKNSEVKKINNEIYFESLDLKSKASFVQMMVKNSFPIILIGKPGSGKSRFMEYLQVTINPDDYAYLPMRLRKGMSFEDFKEILFKKTRISIKAMRRKCFCSSTSKKLVILIDDFNLLETDSEIGEFLISCIKNRYYYDTTTNQKIYIYNISFVVAENDNYESRIDNRFLKYFKPIYINEFEVRKIAEVYSNELSDIQFAREIFDASESIHNNFIMNLQSNQEIKRPFPFSHQNVLRIMQCIKDYAEKDIKLVAEGKEKRQNLAKVWAYVSKLEYTGYSLSPQIEERIEKEIKNRLNLIIQNSSEKPKPVPYLSNLIDELVNKNNLLKADGQREEYYEYFSFLISMTQPRNLLTIGEPLPENIKAKVLEYTAEVHELKFYHVKNTEKIKNIEFRNSLIYISTENFDELLSIFGFITNNAQCKQGRYILDCQNHAQFERLIKYVPHVCSMFNFFTKKNSFSRHLISAQYNDWLTKLEQDSGKRLSQRQELTIISNLLEKQKEIKLEISKKKKIACNFIERYLRLNQEIEANSKKVEEIKLNIKELQEKEEYIATHKKEMSQNLAALNNTKLEDEAEEERVQNVKKLKESINEAENQAKEIKNKKKILSENISEIEATIKLSRQVSSKLAPRYEEFLQARERIQALEPSESSIIFCLSLYYFGIKNQNKEFIEFVEKQDQLKKIDLNHILQVIFDINPSDIRQEVVVWVLESKAILVKDINNRFLRFIKKAIPRIRIINELHSLSVNFAEPVIYTGKYDPSVLNVPHLTYIINQDPSQIAQELKYLTFIKMNDSLQNQKETIKLSIYSQKEKQISYQIFALEQEIHQLFLQISSDQEKSVQIFIDPHQKDFKRLKSLLYSQSERLEKLKQNLKNAKTGLDMKYQPILDTCCLFKKILETIQENVDYFRFTEKQFSESVLRSAGIKSSSQRTSKKLASHGLISKKSLGRTKSRKQIPTEMVNSGINIQPLDSPNILVIPQTQLVPKEQPQEMVVQAREEEIPETYENFMELFSKRMINQLLSKIILGFKSQDSLFSYVTLACFMNEHQFGLPFLHRQSLNKIIKKQSLSQENLLELQIQIETRISQTPLQEQSSSKLIEILHCLRNLYSVYKQDPNSIIQKVIKFADVSLNKFYEDLLNEKYNVQLLNRKENIIILSNQRQNPFEILEKHILSSIDDSNWCYMFENQINTEKIIEMSEKCAINLFIIINNRKASLFEQLKEIQKQKDLTFIFLYSNELSLLELKKCLPSHITSQIQELEFVYAQDTRFIYKQISEIYLNTFTKIFSEEKPEIQQLLRITFYNEATELLRKIHKNKLYNRSQEFYSTKMLSEIFLKLQNLSFNQAAKILIKICYQNQKERQSIVFKQAKKIINKKENLISTFIEFFNKDYLSLQDITFDGSAFITENNKFLTEKFFQCLPQQIVSMLVPQNYRKKYPLDNLYISVSSSQILKVDKKPLRKQFIQEKAMAEISKILNEFPTNIILESQNLKKQKQFYKELVQDEIRFKLNGLRKIEQNLKKYKKILEKPKKILSESTQNEFENLQKYVMQQNSKIEQISNEKQIIEVVQEFVAREQKSLEYLDKLYLSKQNQKLFDPSHFRSPLQFIKYYLYESNPQANFKTGEIQARYLTDKDKEAHYDVPEECKSLLISQIVIKNAKFDQNKNTLEPNDKQEPNKILNVHICFNDKEVPHLNSSLPVYFNNNKLFNLLVISKVKDESVWKDKLNLFIDSK